MRLCMNDNPVSKNPTALMTRMVMISALLIIIIGVVIYRSFAALPFAFGVIITSGLNIIKIRMLEQTVRKVIEMDDPEAGKNVVRLRYLLRYFLTGVVLVAVGLIHSYTTPPPLYSSRGSYLAVWSQLFPGGPESLLSSPLISIWGALAGIFTLQLSVILVRSMKLEKDGDNFIEYVDDEESDENDEVLSEDDSTITEDDEVLSEDDKEALEGQRNVENGSKSYNKTAENDENE